VRLTELLGRLPAVFGKSSFERKVDLEDQLRGFYGRHRSGWIYALENLKPLHRPGGIMLDSFIERTFCWHPGGPRPNLRPWVGFIHVPPRVPRWFVHEQSNEFIFSTDYWKQSLPYCRGLFTLSRYHRSYLESRLPVQVENLIFPTETPGLKWSMERFHANKEKKIAQIGWWLRNLHTIFRLPPTCYKKIFIFTTYADLGPLFRHERQLLGKAFDERLYDTVQWLPYLSDSEYDELLASNILILNLYDSSANNTVIECIVRNTPLLVNRLEAVEEYLGSDYPFYYSSLEEAAAKAEDNELIERTHFYLRDHPIKTQLSGTHFMTSFATSGIYSALDNE
jgi:hypothetical protein